MPAADPPRVALEWAVAARPLPGQVLSGDSHLVQEEPQGHLVAVVDGLGHGPAAHAAGAAVRQGFAEAPEPADLVAVLAAGHAAARSTRGAVATLLWVNPGAARIRWIGVGNIAGVVVRADPHAAGRPREWLVPQAGVIGFRLPPPRISQVDLAPGDLVILATDGLASAFGDDLGVLLSPTELAPRLLARFARDTDDALVWVGRRAGGGS